MKGYEQVTTDEIQAITCGDAKMIGEAYDKIKAKNPKFVEYLKRGKRIGLACGENVFRKKLGGRNLRKFFIVLLMLSLSACGAAGVSPQAGPSSSPGPVIEQPQTPSESVAVQPFLFEPVSDYLHGQPIDIIALPNGFWIVATLNGQVYLLNADFKTVRHFSIPVQTFHDSGLMSAVLDNEGRVYFYFTAFSDLPECQDVFCNVVVRYEIDQQQEDFLKNPETVAIYPMVNQGGVHNGGGMAFASDGMLYVAVGEGELSDEMTYPYAQDPASPLGKVHRIDPETLDSEQVASGLRNPFTAIPTAQGMLLGDVGFEAFEEVNLLPWDEEQNFGWPLTEGPFYVEQWPDFTQPLHAFRHCDEIYKDQDPEGHTQGKALTIKNHAGIVHPCGSEIIAVSAYYAPRQEGFPDPYGGALDGAVIYGEPYYGWVRAFDFDVDSASGDRHIAHMPGLMAMAEGLDGYLYGVSLFASNQVLRLIPNPEAH